MPTQAEIDKQKFLQELIDSIPDKVQQAMDIIGSFGLGIGASKAFPTVGKNVFKAALRKEALAAEDKLLAETGKASAEDIAKVLSRTSEGNKPFAALLKDMKIESKATPKGEPFNFDKASFAKRRPTIEQLLHEGKTHSVPLGTKTAAQKAVDAVGKTKLPTKAKLAGATLIGATAASTPDTPPKPAIPVPAEKRLEQAVEAQTTPKGSVPSIMQDKESAKIIRESVALTNDPELSYLIQPGFKSSRKVALTPKDFTVVQASDEPGQTIYKVNSKTAKKLGIKSEAGFFFNIPEDKPYLSVPKDNNPLSVEPSSPQDALHRAQQHLIAIQDTTLKTIKDGLEQSSPVLASLYKELEYHQKYVDSPDPKEAQGAQEDVTSVQKDIAIVKRAINESALTQMQIDPEVQKAQLDYQLQAAHASKVDTWKTKQKHMEAKIQGAAKVITQATNLDTATALGLLTSEVPEQQRAAAQWAQEYAFTGKIPSLSSSNVTFMARTLTKQAHLKKAIQWADTHGQDRGLILAEMQQIRDAQSNALLIISSEAEKKTRGIVSTEQETKLASLTYGELVRQAAQSGIIKTQIQAAKVAAGLVGATPQDDIEALKTREGLDDDQARNVIENVFNSIHADYLGLQVGLTPATVNAAARAEFRKYYPLSIIQALTGGN